MNSLTPEPPRCRRGAHSRLGKATALRDPTALSEGCCYPLAQGLHVCWLDEGRGARVMSPVADATHLGLDLSPDQLLRAGATPVAAPTFCAPFQDSHPLASLPLLGYSLTIPSESEDLHKDYVFKLHFKSHVYYFRAESEYTFER